MSDYREDCYFYYEAREMGAYVPNCSYNHKYEYGFCPCSKECKHYISKAEAYELIKNLVRCKDCKYWSAERINDFNKCRRWINVGVKNFATMGDWFCADGERRD